MAWRIEDWKLAVVEAASSHDEVALAALWREGQHELGPDAGTLWARTISALDSSAVTG